MSGLFTLEHFSPHFRDRDIPLGHGRRSRTARRDSAAPRPCCNGTAGGRHRSGSERSNTHVGGFNYSAPPRPSCTSQYGYQEPSKVRLCAEYSKRVQHLPDSVPLRVPSVRRASATSERGRPPARHRQLGPSGALCRRSRHEKHTFINCLNIK